MMPVTSEVHVLSPPREVPEWLLAEIDQGEVEGAWPMPVDPCAGLTFPALASFVAFPDCPCCTEAVPAALDAAQSVRWDIPGLGWGDTASPPALPALSPEVARLQELLGAVTSIDPVTLPGPQALVDAQALLAVAQQLRTHNLSRLADVHLRGLNELVDARSAHTWVAQTSPDTDSTDLLLGRRLREFPVVADRLDRGVVGLLAAKRLTLALTQLRRHVDRPDGLIDGQPAVEVVPAVVRHVVSLVAQSRFGLPDEDPLLGEVTAAVERILSSGGSDLEQLEQAFTVLAEHVPARHLRDAVGELTDALLPNQLEARAQRGQDRAGVHLTLHPDGSGWQLRGDLDLETGELLHTLLGAEARRDAENTRDTADAQTLRDVGLDPYDSDGPPGPGGAQGAGGIGESAGDPVLRSPRRRARRLHDALRLLLQRYLDADLAGSHHKQPVRVTVTVASDLLNGQPGAPAATAGSGARIPAGLLRRWWCNAQVTAFLRTVGWLVLGQSHSQRTLTAAERTALDVQSGGHRCAGLTCCQGRPHPGVTLEPHHVTAWSSTSSTHLGDTVWACPTLHHDLHHDRTVTLRDGRRLNAEGWVA